MGTQNPRLFFPWWAPYPVLNNDGHLDPAPLSKLWPSLWDTDKWVSPNPKPQLSQILPKLLTANDLFLTLSSGTSSVRNENLRPLLITNIPLFSGKYGLRNHFWPLESDFSHEQKWEKGARSNETSPTPFYRSTRFQNSCQIEFSSRNGREISSSVFWND